MFFSHRDLDIILSEYASNRPFFLYTGRGPSSPSMHLGHLLPFLITKSLQETFDVPVVVQMTDDEKYLYRDLSLKDIEHNLIENCKDIIACGFNPKKTFIFSNFAYMGTLYPNVVKVQRLLTNNVVANTFGVKGSDNIGQTSFAAIQAAPSFHSSFPIVFKNDTSPRRCLVPCGIDQDLYFRLTRDAAARLDYLKPALIHTKFLPALQGIAAKMSSSDPDSSIFLTDSYEEIKNKIKKFAFSGGRETTKEHRQYGANLDVDICYLYLQFFLEDDEEMERIRIDYGSGKMLTSEIKNRTTEVLANIIKRHQQARAQITNEVVLEFMKERPLDT